MVPVSLQFSKPLPCWLGVPQHVWLWGRLRIYSNSHTEWASPSPARPLRGSSLHSLACRSLLSSSSCQKDRVPWEWKLPVLLPHNFVWSSLLLGKVEREQREKITEISPHHIYIYIYSSDHKGSYFWFFWMEIQNDFQSFSSVWCHCGVKQLGLPWGRA